MITRLMRWLGLPEPEEPRGAEQARDTAAFRQELREHRESARREVARLRRLPAYDGGFIDSSLFHDFPSYPQGSAPPGKPPGKDV